MSLSLKFSLAASIVVAIGMAATGSWVAARIADGVVKNATSTARFYVENFIAPHLQQLRSDSDLSDDHKRSLDQLLSPQATSRPILSFRIWKGDTVVYSDRKDDIGRTFSETAARSHAWKGAVVGELDQASAEHRARSISPDTPVLEIYAPVHERGSDRVIALAETYEVATDLKRELTRAQFQSWLFMGFVTLQIIGTLFGIVHNGSQTIERQRASLEQRITELSRLLAENSELRMGVNQANERVAETNERLLRRIGADLHDGPVQLLGLSLLKLGDLSEAIEETNPELLEKTDAAEIMRGALIETLQEIRNISSGLAPPDIENLSVHDTLQMVASKHEERTRTHVQRELHLPNVYVPFPVKTCLYRFAQEALNNAYQHAGGAGQALIAKCDRDTMEVQVVDKGPGMSPRREAGLAHGQGLNGLRDRIESLGGTFEVRSLPGEGTSLVARFGIAPWVSQP